MIYWQRLKRCNIVLVILILVGLSVYTLVLHNDLEQEKNSNVALEEQIQSTQEQLQESKYQLEELQKKMDKQGTYIVNYRRRNTDFYIENTIPENKYVPWVSMQDKELQAKINQTLSEGFFEWLPVYFNYCNDEELIVELNSENYLSILIHYVKYGEKIDNFYMTNTVNMQTGEWVPLDDVVEVDEELLSILLTEGIPKTDYSIVSGEYDVDLSADLLARFDSDYELEIIWENLQECSQEYTSDDESITKEWATKGSFWLTEDRLYLHNVLFLGSTLYIEYEDIAHKIKDKSLLEGA